MIVWTAGHETYTDYSGPTVVKVPKPSYAGVTLGTIGRDERIMSDVWSWITYAQVWDGTKVTLVAVSSSEMGGTYGHVTVDATPEVLAAVAAAAAVAKAAAAKAAIEAAIDREIEWAATVKVGKDVTVVKGRKVAKGTEGRVFWLGDSRYGTRVGLELADGTRVFTALTNVAVTNPDEYLDIEALIARRAA